MRSVYNIGWARLELLLCRRLLLPAPAVCGSSPPAPIHPHSLRSCRRCPAGSPPTRARWLPPTTGTRRVPARLVAQSAGPCALLPSSSSKPSPPPFSSSLLCPPAPCFSRLRRRRCARPCPARTSAFSTSALCYPPCCAPLCAAVPPTAHAAHAPPPALCLLCRAGMPEFALDLRHGSQDLRAALKGESQLGKAPAVGRPRPCRQPMHVFTRTAAAAGPLLERAIGVIYRPQTERQASARQLLGRTRLRCLPARLPAGARPTPPERAFPRVASRRATTSTRRCLISLTTSSTSMRPQVRSHAFWRLPALHSKGSQPLAFTVWCAASCKLPASACARPCSQR